MQPSNIENSFEQKTIIQHTFNDFHVARSIFLDAFSELEKAVSKLLSCSPTFNEVAKTPFGNRIQELKNLKPCQKISKEKCAKLSDKIDRIRPIMLIRSDIVHSEMNVVNLNGVMHAKICNNYTVVNDPTLVRLLNIECFKILTKEAKKLANELNQMFNPPSSPLQPLQGVKAGL